MNYTAEQIQQLIAGDEEVFTRLYHDYYGLLFHQAYKYVRHRQDAEDIVQEAYVRIYRSLPRYNCSCKISTWMLLIVKNLCFDLLRQHKRKPTVFFEEQIALGNKDYPLLESFHDSIKGPEKHFMAQEEYNRVMGMVNKLPDAYRDIFQLRYFSEYSLAEISSILSLEVNTVKSRLFRGKKYLRKNYASMNACS